MSRQPKLDERAERTSKRASHQLHVRFVAARRRSLLVVRSLNSVITDIIDTFNTNKIYIMYTINRFGGNGNGKLGRARWRIGTKAGRPLKCVQFTENMQRAAWRPDEGKKKKIQGQGRAKEDTVESLKRCVPASEERRTSIALVCTTRAAQRPERWSS